jgi:peptidoglycan/xylan/chitin deacetylase (PgdA/CDA1 family)
MTKTPAPRKKRSRHPRDWSWPKGAKIAVTLNMALESFVRASQVTLEKTSNKIDHFSLTYADYAYKAGAWRLLDLMEEFKIKGSVSTNGLTGERQPQVVRAFADFGCEIVGHRWAQDVLAKDDDPATELAEMRKVTAVLTEVAGTRPVGWVSQGSAGSTNTLDFLKMEGYLWSGDDMSDDLPFRASRARGRSADHPAGQERLSSRQHARRDRPHQSQCRQAQLRLAATTCCAHRKGLGCCSNL